MPKVTVIITAYNYSRYLRQAINSVLNQTFHDFELIIVDDASSDDTPQVLQEYQGQEKIKVITHRENQGLVVSTSEAISQSRGEYLVRLDADDYFDENALLILSTALDSHPEVGLVYPDYFAISEKGDLVNYVRLPRVNDEVRLLDLPAHGAGTMFRRHCYEAVGGYDQSLRWQDNYDLWLKIISRFPVYNVNLPLFYYRHHPASLSGDSQNRLQARRYVKRSFLDRELKAPSPKALGIIPARVHDYCDYLALRKLGNKPLIAYIIGEALKAKGLDRVIFTTEDERIAQVARSYGAEVMMRPPELTQSHIEGTVIYVLRELKKSGFEPDIVALLHVSSPFVRVEHIAEAIHTLLIYDVDSVISVYEDKKFHYQHDTHGLRPLYQKRLLRQEKESLYEETGAIYVSRGGVITEQNFLGQRIGHILMTREESIRINSELDFQLAEQVVSQNIGHYPKISN